MARPVKKGIDYFPLDVDIFSDRKMMILYSRFGTDGFTIYMYLLCTIYSEGYYIKVDDDLCSILALKLNMSAEKIGQVLNFLLERSLFDNKLFESDKVLTSAGIQRRYQLAVRTRAAKNPITAEKRLWLLDRDETEAFILVRPDENSSGKNDNYSGKNPHNSRNKCIKKSKVKKSKVKKSKVNQSFYGKDPSPETKADATDSEKVPEEDTDREDDKAYRDRELSEIREQIDYDRLCSDGYSENTLRLITDIMYNVYNPKEDTITIRGESLPCIVVRRQFLRLDYDHIVYVLDSVRKTGKEIRNFRSYLLTSLYNAPHTIDMYYDNMRSEDISQTE